MKYIVGKWISKPIYAAAELGIADLLAGGPMSAAELAENCGAHERSLYRMMRALASIGIFHERGDGAFELTPMAELLRSDAMAPIARTFNAPWNDEAWMYYLDGVRTGKTPFRTAHGRPLFRWLEDHPHEEAMLMEANAIKAAASHRAILDAYDFSGFQTLVDVGGGDGTLAAHILGAHPGMTGIVADTPSVIKKARDLIRSVGLEHRCTAVACDFFESIPQGGDAYLMSNILHDWDDERCTRILRTCISAQRPGSRLLVVESVVPAGNEPSIAKLLDLEMFVVTGGMERTESEYRTLLESAGYVYSDIVQTGDGLSILQCLKPGDRTVSSCAT
jgi:hypothetical protein